LDSPSGPTYDGVRKLLHPLMLVGRPAGLKATRPADSGLYHRAFGEPSAATGAGRMQLHVADGSQIVSQRVDGSKLTVVVGARGTETHGAWPPRLQNPPPRG